MRLIFLLLSDWLFLELDTLATFQLSKESSLSVDEFTVWTIGEAISSAPGLRNFTGIYCQNHWNSHFLVQI